MLASLVHNKVPVTYLAIWFLYIGLNSLRQGGGFGWVEIIRRLPRTGRMALCTPCLEECTSATW